MTDHLVRDQQCPTCKAHLTAAAGIDHDDLPLPGDRSICLYCGAALEFAEDMSLQLADESTFDEEDAEVLAELRETVALVRSGVTRH